MKKIINTRLHGILDYMSGFILILPWIVCYYEKNNDTWILASVGALTVIMSLITDYEFGLIKVIPMKIHLVIDVLTALFLIILPFAFPLYHYALYWPVLLGCGELIIILLSSSKPYITTARDLNITQP